MKKIILLCATFALMAGLSGCSTELTPTETATCFIDGVKTENYEFTEATYGSFDLDTELQNNKTVQYFVEDEEIGSAVDRNIRNFKYDTNGEEIDDDEAIVTLTVTYKDYGELIRERSSDYLSGLTNLKDITDDDMRMRALDILKTGIGDAKSAKEKIKVYLTRKGGKWLVNDIGQNKELMNALTCNIANGTSQTFQELKAKKVSEGNKEKKEKAEAEALKKQKAKEEAEKRTQEKQKQETADKKQTPSSTFSNDTLTTSDAVVKITRWETQSVENGTAFVVYFNFKNKSSVKQDPLSVWARYFVCSLGEIKKVKGMTNAKISKGQNIDYAVGYEYDEDPVELKVVKGKEQLGKRVFSK